MNIVVIGLGSMGKRRIRLLRQIQPHFNILGVDLNKERRFEVQDKYSVKTLDQLNNEEADVAFVCTSPLSHGDIIRTCLKKNKHVFTEINLVDHLYDENIALAKEKERVLFLSSTFLYREEIRYIKKAVSSAKCPLNYVYHVGQYLPDWHPWENYSSYFVGDKRTNGCREIMAIELPWLTHVFGDVSECHTIKSRNTHLDIDYNDNYLIQLQHINGAKGAFAVDVVSRKAVRNLEIYGEEIYLSWDGTPTGLKHYDYMGRTDHDIKLYSDNEVDHQTGYSSFVIENAYKNEIENFFGKINGGGAIFCIV